MYIIKVRYDKSHIKNVFSCKDFSILAREVVLIREGKEDKYVHLNSNDLVFIMNSINGDTLDKYVAPQDPDEPKSEEE